MRRAKTHGRSSRTLPHTPIPETFHEAHLNAFLKATLQVLQLKPFVHSPKKHLLTPINASNCWKRIETQSEEQILGD